MTCPPRCGWPRRWPHSGPARPPYRGPHRLGELLGLVPEPSVDRVSALNGAAWLAIDQGDYPHATGLLEASIGLSRILSDTVGEGIATVYLGRCTMSSGRIADGAPDVERAVALANEAGDRPAIAFVTFYSALVALLTGSQEAACDLFARCGALAAELGLTPLCARARLMLGYPLLDLGELPAARTALAEGFQMSTDVGDRWFVQLGLGGFVGLAAVTGRPRLALRLAGAAEAYGSVNQFSMPGPMVEIVDRWLASARAKAGPAAARWLAEGRGSVRSKRSHSSWPTSRMTPRTGPAPDADPSGDRGRGAGGTRADQPGHRRAAVPLGQDRRGARGPHPHQAGVPYPDPAGCLGVRGRPAAGR